MSVIKVPTTFNIDLEFEVPEFFRRLVALLIDVFIEYIYIRVGLVVFQSIVRSSDASDIDTQYNLWSIGWLFLLPLILYHVVLEITMNGQSVGKKIMGIRVVNENGGKASISQFLIRWLLRVSDLWMAIVLILLAVAPGALGDTENTIIILLTFAFMVTDIVLVVSSKKGQRIGDILAHTILIKTKSQVSIEETIFQEVADSYIPSFPQIMQLSDRDINAIKSILETARKKDDYNMAASAADKIKLHLKIDSSMSPFDFLDLLLKDYNYLSTK
ncbi:MAG: RDD family protein [Chitinophagaceae bacterium]